MKENESLRLEKSPAKDPVESINTDFRRYALLVTLGALLVIGIGACVTSQANGRQLASRGMFNAIVHRDAAVAVIVLAISLALLLSQAQEIAFLGWIAAGVLAMDGWAGWLGRPLVHATLAPLGFSIFAAIALLSSSKWGEAPEFVDVRAAPLLRPLAMAGPALVLVQTLLGAAYRHKAIGVTAHLAGAMIVSIALLVAATLVMQQYPTHRALRSAAVWLLSILLTQVILGATAFAMQLLDVGNAIALIAVTASHVVVGSLTLAASMVLAMQVQRNVRSELRRDEAARAANVADGA